MTRLTRIKLKDMSPLHLGLGRDSYDVSASVLQSDMLSAALASVRAMHGEGDSTRGFLESFALSSAFPYDGDEFFLPRMKGRLSISVRGEEEKDYRKKLKKLSYISMPVWRSLVQGEDIKIDKDQLHGEFLLAKPTVDYKSPMTHLITQRVSVSRSGEEDAVPFMFDWTFFKHGVKDIKGTTVAESGLYCLLQADEAVADEVTNLFNELGTMGIGSDKTVGGGQFTIEADTVELPEVDSNKQMLLSTYIPDKEDMQYISLNESEYQLIHRGGFMAGSTVEELRHLRRKTVYMFDTGSVISSKANLKGRVVDVSPKWNATDMHPVYRSGKPMAIYINQR